MGVRAAPVAPAPVVVAPTWTGVYLGVNGGWGWTGSNSVTLTPVGIAGGSFSTGQTSDGAVFGGQLGYNWQTGNWVFGIEGDVDGYGARNSTHTTGTPTLAVAFTASEAPTWLASARGRVGYARGTGLIYITGGGAWANMAFNTTDALGVSSLTATKSGWTLGGGYEWMFAPNWSLRAEYLYYMFNSGATTATVFPPPGGGAITHTWSGANVQIARVGLNYKFDWGAPSPGVAPWALAAGPGVRAASVAPAPVVVAPTWTGVYLGVNGGWGWTGSNSVSVTLPAAPTFGAFSTGQSSDGAVFGGQLGYNWQTGNWVFGIEGDVDGYGARNATTTHTASDPRLGLVVTASEAPNWLASARGRVGYAWGPGLIYITGGGAWANMQYSTTDAAAVSSLTATKSGWTLGGGYEWMFVPNWSLRAEYLYYKFDGGATTTAVFNPPNVGVLTHTWSGASVNIARVGLNYKFDWGRW